jgi:hypothetical protein
VTVLAVEQIQDGAKRFFELERVEPVELFSLNCIRFPPRCNTENVPRGTAGIEFHRFQKTRFPGIVLSNEKVQASQSREVEFAKELESGDVEGWNHG